MFSFLMTMFLMMLMFLKKDAWGKVLIQGLYFFFSFNLLLYSNSSYYWSSSSVISLFGLDQYNYVLLVFLFWLMGLSSLSLLRNSGSNLGGFLLFALMFFVFLSFMSMNFFFFYFFFESSLLPIYMLVVVFGVNYKRFLASNYMLMYTLFFSLPMLLVFCFCFYEFNSLLMVYLFFESFFLDFIFYLMCIFAFLVKMPMYSLHIWLPKAHVEAPCAGSMMLAGILLKLGSYGLLRSMMIMLESSLNFNIFILPYSLVGALIASVLCLRQSDLKILIAYSSVVHMGLMISGMMTLSFLGFMGSLYMMVGHGLCSSGLFYLVNVSYNRLGSRLIYMNKGLIVLMPSLSLWWFLLCSSNMSSPVSLNLLSEIFLICSLLLYDVLLMILVVLISFFSAYYSIYLFSSSQHGSVSFLKNFFNSGSFLEFLVSLLHWFPLNIVVLNMSLICCLSLLLLLF